MPRKRPTPEEIVAKLRQVDVLCRKAKASRTRCARLEPPRSPITVLSQIFA